MRYKDKRAITLEEHQKIITAEVNPERKALYQLCWHLGGSQGDIANLKGEDVDWKNKTISFTRKKTGVPVIVHLGTEALNLFKDLPAEGNLFPYLSSVRTNDRATEFRSRCRQLNIEGVTLHNTYDSVARLTGTYLHGGGGALLDQSAYAYNLAGQRTSVTRTAGDYVNYGYDNIGELTSANGFESGGASRWQEQLGYLYDAAGNLNYRTNNALIQNFNLNKLNELTNLTRSGTFTVAGTTSSGATNVTVNTSNAVLYADHTFASTNQSLVNGMNTFTAIAKDFLGNAATNVSVANLLATNTYVYDLNGNLRTNGTKLFAYDDENELISVWVASAWSNSFAYDGKLRRRIEKDFNWSGTAWVETNEVHFIYDGNVIIQQRDSNNVPTLTLTRGLDLSGSLQGAGGIGGLLAMTEGSGTNSYYHSDGNGNVTMLLDANQNVVAKAAYEPYGNFLVLTGPKAHVNCYWYSSKPINWQSGNYDFLRRWYIPDLDRFANRDPIKELGGLNLFVYVGNNPINTIDFYGLITFWGRVGMFSGGVASVTLGGIAILTSEGPWAVLTVPGGYGAVLGGAGLITGAFLPNTPEGDKGRELVGQTSSAGGNVGMLVGGQKGSAIGSVVEDVATLNPNDEQLMQIANLLNLMDGLNDLNELNTNNNLSTLDPNDEGLLEYTILLNLLNNQHGVNPIMLNPCLGSQPASQ